MIERYHNYGDDREMLREVDKGAWVQYEDHKVIVQELMEKIYRMEKEIAGSHDCEY